MFKSVRRYQSMNCYGVAWREQRPTGGQEVRDRAARKGGDQSRWGHVGQAKQSHPGVNPGAIHGLWKWALGKGKA